MSVLTMCLTHRWTIAESSACLEKHFRVEQLDQSVECAEVTDCILTESLHSANMAKTDGEHYT